MSIFIVQGANSRKAIKAHSYEELVLKGTFCSTNWHVMVFITKLELATIKYSQMFLLHFVTKTLIQNWKTFI